MPDRRLFGHRRSPAAANLDALAPVFRPPSDAEIPVLHALLRISHIVAGADYFDEALEGIAEHALVALDAASVAISRWEQHTNTLRTLINVGDLAPQEQRWPTDEVYPVTGDEHVTRLLRHGLPYTNAVDDPNRTTTSMVTLNEVGKNSEMAVPVMFDDVMWGEIWASGSGARRFGHDDVQLLQAIAAYASVAIGRTELFSTVWRFAHEDPLTGLANRRALDDHFADMDPGVPGTVLVCDLDGFKHVNDRDGHAAGDALLREVADMLRHGAKDADDAMVARLGGDEFCVVLPNASTADAEQFARAVGQLMRGQPVTLSWGAAEFGCQRPTGQELLAAADAALLEAKTMGPERFSAGSVGIQQLRPAVRRRERTTTDQRGTEQLVPRVVALLDELRPIKIMDALEVVAAQTQSAVNAAAWTISVTDDDGGTLRAQRGVNSIGDPLSGLAVLTGIDVNHYAVADYPHTARAIDHGEAFLEADDLPGSDPGEVAILHEFGYRAVLFTGLRYASRGYLLEIFSSGGYAELAAAAPHLRVLTQYCASVACC